MKNVADSRAAEVERLRGANDRLRAALNRLRRHQGWRAGCRLALEEKRAEVTNHFRDMGITEEQIHIQDQQTALLTDSIAQMLQGAWVGFP